MKQKLTREDIQKLYNTTFKVNMGLGLIKTYRFKKDYILAESYSSSIKTASEKIKYARISKYDVGRFGIINKEYKLRLEFSPKLFGLIRHDIKIDNSSNKELLNILYLYIDNKKHNIVMDEPIVDFGDDDALDEMTKKIYNKCLEKNFKSFDDNKSIIIFEIVCSSFGISDNKEQEIFKDKIIELARKQKIQKEEQKQSEVEKEKNKAKLLNDREIELSNYSGKSKYLIKFKNNLAKLEKTKELGNQVKNFKQNEMNYKANTTNPYLFMGMANGVAGVSASIATYNDIANDNLKKEEDAKKIRRKAYNDLVDVEKGLKNVNTSISTTKEYIDFVEYKLYYDKNQNELFNKLAFKTSSIKLLPNGNLFITIDYEIKEDLDILDSPALLDGTIEIFVINSKKEIIGNCYYNAPGFDDVFLSENYKIGFNKIGKIEKECYIDSKLEKDDINSLEIEIKPVFLWMIEK